MEQKKVLIDKRESDAIWIMKAVAVLAIVSCHCCEVDPNAGLINQIATYFFEGWMRFGVPVFYFLSGYFFRCEEKGFSNFWKKKFITIIIPWIVTGTAIWMYVVLRKGGISLRGWLGFVFLRESYLYYLTNLIAFYLVLYYVRKWKYLRYAVSCAVVLSIILQICGIRNLFTLTDMMQVTNPFICFYIGMVFGIRKWLGRFRAGIWSLGICFFIGFRVIDRVCTMNGNYAWMIFLITFLALIISLFSISYQLAGKEQKILQAVGRKSYSIYLLHMPAAGVIANLLNRSYSFAILTFVRPIIVIAITMFLVWIYEKITKKNKWFMLLIGEREYENRNY